MTNFSRTQPDGTWVTGYQVTPADLVDLSRKTFDGINGKRGGVYAPSSPIEIPSLAGDDGMILTTMLEVRAGGILRIETGGTIVLSDSDYQDLESNHPGRVREIYQAMAPVAVVGADHFGFLNVVPMGGVQSIASEIRRSIGSAVPAFVKELRVHHGARLTKVVVGFRVPTPHAAAPQEMPKFRVFRVNLVTGVEENLNSTQEDGFVSIPSAKSGVAWHSSGAYQEFTIPIDQNATIDNGAYSYRMHVVEERAGVPEYPFQVQVWEAAVIQVASGPGEANPGTGNLDNYGAAWPSGTVGLFKTEVFPRFNGVWTSPGGAGPWTRHPALNATPHFRNGMLFEVKQSLSGEGKSSPGTVWQMTLPPPFVLDVSDISIAEPTPRGTLFIGVTTHHDSITSTRWA